jgi:hypothetical protein
MDGWMDRKKEELRRLRLAVIKKKLRLIVGVINGESEGWKKK